MTFQRKKKYITQIYWRKEKLKLVRVIWKKHVQGHCHSCHLLLVRTCCTFWSAACSTIYELSLPQKKKKKAEETGFACYFASYCLHLTGQELRSVSQRTVCACQQGTQQKCLTTKKKNDLLWIIERSITAGALVDSWCYKSQYDTILIIKSLWCTFNLIHPRRVVEWPCGALGQVCTETDPSCLSD